MLAIVLMDHFLRQRAECGCDDHHSTLVNMKKPQLLCWRCSPVEPVWPHAVAKITHPVAGSAQSIGAFSNGCIVGASIPLQSDTYQVMRTDQRRYFVP
jgi:murein endopeptidase